MATAQRVPPWRAGVPIALAGAGIIVWYVTLPTGVLIGDDLIAVTNALHGGFLSNPIASLGQTTVDRYRPVLQFLLAIMIRLARSHFEEYESLNLGVMLLNLVIASLICVRLTSSYAVASALGFMVAASRFTYYFVQQMYGLMEGLALAFMLLLVREVLLIIRNQSVGSAIRIVCWFTLAIYTDERYVVLFAPLLLLVGMLCSFGQRRIRLIIAVGASGSLLSNFLLKAFVFHTRFLQGSGEHPITIDIPRISHFAEMALLNTFGFNLGPNYLSALGLTSATLLAWFLASVVAAASLVILGHGFRQWRRGRLTAEGASLAFMLLAFLVLILSASITFRQEFRWLEAPYAALLIIIAACIGPVSCSRSLRNCALLALIVGTLASSIYFRAFLGNVYFYQSFSDGRGAIAALSHRRIPNIAVLDHGDTTLGGWTFSGPDFFQMYGLGSARVSYYRDARRGWKSLCRNSGDVVLDVLGPTVDAHSCKRIRE